MKETTKRRALMGVHLALVLTLWVEGGHTQVTAAGPKAVAPPYSVRREPPKPIVEAGYAGDLKQVEALYGLASKQDRLLAMSAAAIGGHLHVIDFFVNKGVKENLPENALERALGSAGRADEIESIKRLCSYGADPNWKDVTGRTVLDWVLVPGRREAAAVAWALVECGARPGNPIEDEFCADDGRCVKYRDRVLHAAVWTDDVELARHFIKQGEDVNERSGHWLETALFYVSSAAMTRLLLEHERLARRLRSTIFRKCASA